ncbi:MULTISPECIES: 2-dehydro-3-deoxy-6-phosphogalactonate aldolase [unclassified Brevibacterium]|uniref:2-dehydro-3-deoxy-6-phosphogalactonate aldolase n=1 Tax=unclassified Brevibacterium TaxID=2614124 RepID=UPI001E303DFD|nr:MULTISPECIES: 2-dehydro-3-deoxy-6-phosphogalactonate aldolase [unclassified Brevibacterium]MCD1287798.1 2-dehydro-3-deoxy-6-phosphogalactonate aldolase [Brevibacterium sp. CCUG 69071]MDK8435093.1 2-dehydro-3-deoxy-6-phosphogalactonate aldolase [Brevibacterium sp. H-BE7]
MPDSVPAGLIAILRGVRSDEVLDIAEGIVDAGFSAIEVPLNSPDPLASITALVEKFGDTLEIGAGTVLTADQVHECQQAGARIIVAPDTDRDVITTALELGLTPYPGAATPTEAFAGVKAGATNVKLFPSSAVGIIGMKAWREVLPSGTELFPVGGVGADNAADWRKAGAAGLGLGSSLYRRGDRPDDVRTRAQAIASAWAQSF